MNIDKLDYFANSLKKRLTGVDCKCPNCGSNRFHIKDRKYIVTELRRCENCYLMYRAPSDSEQDNESYYQKEYTSGSTTTVPSNKDLATLKNENFSSINHDYSHYIKILESLGLESKDRVFDYGCSWGYGSWQFAKNGYDITAYEISQPRASFAREQLGINALKILPEPDSVGNLAGSFDCFFSSHVIEHVPQPSKVIELAKVLLKPSGYFVAITPNGSDEFRSRTPQAWHKLWGKVHPNLIDDEYWRHALGATAEKMQLDTSPVECNKVNEFHRNESLNKKSHSLIGDDLMCIARFKQDTTYTQVKQIQNNEDDME
jgi:2-polyprenyl-3-methyl-5-hydroxy-6-metoxy-1,4-benzoquinol methylase